jgi:hypothetical protein
MPGLAAGDARAVLKQQQCVDGRQHVHASAGAPYPGRLQQCLPAAEAAGSAWVLCAACVLVQAESGFNSLYSCRPTCPGTPCESQCVELVCVYSPLPLQQ